MKAPMICIALAFSSPVFGQAIEDNVDRFTGSRVIKYDSPGQAPLGQPNFYFHGVVTPEASVFELSFMVANISNYRSGGSGWKYLSCYNVSWLLDGKPLKLSQARHKGDVVRGGVIETISQRLTPQEIDQMGRASGIEYRICNDEFRLTSTDIEALRQISIKLDPNRAPEPPRQADPSKPDHVWDNWK